MNGRRRVFTRQNLALVKQMADQGFSGPEIAKEIGSTPASVRVVCSHHRIRLRRGRGGSARPVPHNQPEHPLQVPVTAYMPAALFAGFNSKANDLHQPTSTFASMLLNAIATSDLYRAVLDD
jgi:hypothetical protein